MHKRVIPGVALALLANLTSVRADDGAASIAAGGIVMKRESRIVMAKEVLKISEDKVIVDYDFRNDMDQDITTEVAFPIPDYELDMGNITPQAQGFDDFKLWVNNVPVHYRTEARAINQGQDVSVLLRSMSIDIASYGHSTDNDTQPQIQRLSPAQKQRLIGVGVIDAKDGTPNWKVRKKYYWSQTFPAHGTIHIRHEYTPVLGNSNTIVGNLVKTGRAAKDEDESELLSVCPTPELLRSLRADTKQRDHNVGISYVDFILTTANTWKMPIEDFTLIIERPPQEKDPNHPATPVNFVSFCWNGPIEKVDANHFRAHVTNLVPKKELRIGFLNGYLMSE